MGLSTLVMNVLKRGHIFTPAFTRYRPIGISVRSLGGNRAGEMQITRFLHNPKVSVEFMTEAAFSQSPRRIKWLSEKLVWDNLWNHNPLINSGNNSQNYHFDLSDRAIKQKNTHTIASLAYAAWVCARSDGWTGYYSKPGPIVMLRGLHRLRAIQLGWSIAQDVWI